MLATQTIRQMARNGSILGIRQPHLGQGATRQLDRVLIDADMGEEAFHQGLLHLIMSQFGA